MTRVLLVHGGHIPHYRVSIYNYLSNYLTQYRYELIVTSNGINIDSSEAVEFKYVENRLSTISVAKMIREEKVDILIDFMELKHSYLFPTYLIAKGLLGCKMIYWGQGRDLLDSKNLIKNLGYSVEQSMCAAIILYAEHLKKYVPKRFHRKLFIANNTLCLSYPGIPPGVGKEMILNEYGITTRKNIICMGRMQKRKRIDQLEAALHHMRRPDIGLILVGPDEEGILNTINGANIYKLGPIYGNKRHDLLSAADVSCIPGAVGLSIVDALYCGLPFVTEEGDESAEIMYLKNGINGFIVPRGNVSELSSALVRLLDDNELRKEFSEAAKREIQNNGSMDVFCLGFKQALNHTIRNSETS